MKYSKSSFSDCRLSQISIESYFDEKLDIHHISPRDWCDDK